MHKANINKGFIGHKQQTPFVGYSGESWVVKTVPSCPRKEKKVDTSLWLNRHLNKWQCYLNRSTKCTTTSETSHSCEKSGNINMDLRRYKLLLIISRCHLCKVSFGSLTLHNYFQGSRVKRVKLVMSWIFIFFWSWHLCISNVNLKYLIATKAILYKKLCSTHVKDINYLNESKLWFSWSSWH